MNYRKVIILFILFVSANSVFGQVNYFVPEYGVGVRGGATASWVSFSPSVAQSSTYGLQAGGVFRYVSAKYFGVQVEANFTQRGWTEQSNAYTYTRQLNYVEVPFLSHIYFGGKVFRWFFNLGPSVSYQISDNVESTVTNIEQNPRHTMAVKNRLDYAIAVGTGFEFNTKRAGIYQLEARYSFGLGDMFPNSATDDYRRSSNQNLSVCLGLLFNAGKR